ncbi:hypothetical protein AVEN_248040-1 [Araneus ventricosus]|uniref:Uncharacterized protein n=1 Tax=Araneus ventricosus TaxID=182803 RepID=A0A4Y2HKK4_ARAVE|nr:hypothetical protein AVEN_248040-1 [Araneus ventricosus]
MVISVPPTVPLKEVSRRDRLHTSSDGLLRLRTQYSKLLQRLSFRIPDAKAGQGGPDLSGYYMEISPSTSSIEWRVCRRMGKGTLSPEGIAMCGLCYLPLVRHVPSFSGRVGQWPDGWATRNPASELEGLIGAYIPQCEGDDRIKKSSSVIIPRATATVLIHPLDRTRRYPSRDDKC